MVKRLSIFVFLALILIVSSPASGGYLQFASNFVYLPIVSVPLPPPTIPPPPVGDNVQCSTVNAAQICAWVSNGTPLQNSEVTVYGRLLINNIGQPGQAMTTSWHYKSTTQPCPGSTGFDGVAACSRQIGLASIGYQVNVDVSIGGYSVSTWFTPR